MYVCLYEYTGVVCVSCTRVQSSDLLCLTVQPAHRAVQYFQYLHHRNILCNAYDLQERALSGRAETFLSWSPCEQKSNGNTNT